MFFVYFLVDIDVYIESNYDIVLILVCVGGYEEFVFVFIVWDVKIEYRDKKGFILLILVVIVGYVGVVEIFLDKGGDIEV